MPPTRFVARARWLGAVWIIWTAVQLLAVVATYLRTTTGELAPAPGWPWVSLIAIPFWATVTLPVTWLSRRVPFGRVSWPGVMVAHLCGLFVVIALDGGLEWLIDPAIHGRHRYTYWQSMWRWALFDAFYYAGIVAVEHAARYYRLYIDRRLRAAELEAQVASAQLQALQMQIRPHFLFNVLNTISGLVRIGDQAAAIDMLAALGELLRTLLRSDGAQEIPLSRELDLIERYLRIEQIRFGDQLQIDVAVEPGTEDALVPNLILQPLVENAIRHGLDTAGRVSIAVERSGPALRLVISNSGDLAPREASNGIGLTNTRARLERLYGEDHRLELSHTASGASVVVELPLRVAAP